MPPSASHTAGSIFGVLLQAQQPGEVQSAAAHNKLSQMN